MAIDLEAIRNKIKQLKSKGNGKTWKPKPGKYLVRILPLSDNEQPCIERFFYYGISGTLMAPYQFDKPDPIKEFIDRLYESGKKEDRELAYKIRPKSRAYFPIIVRQASDDFKIKDMNKIEGDGPLLWSCNSYMQEQILSYFVDSDYGIISDPDEGWDLKVEIRESDKKVNNKSFNETKIDIKPKPSKLSSDPDLVNKWISEIPSIDDEFPLKTYAELDKIFKRWLNGGADKSDASEDDGTIRGTVEVDQTQAQLDEIAKSISTQSVNNESKLQKGKKSSKKEENDPVKTASKSLDDELADL